MVTNIGLAINTLVLNKVYLNVRINAKDKDGYFNTNRMFNPPCRYNKTKFICTKYQGFKYMHHKSAKLGVPVVAQWLTNPTRNHEVEGSIPGLARWVKDPALP